jgi:hypothetical protein
MTSSDANSGDGRSEIAALREDIRHTRAELGQTVEALAAKADVKARVKESAEHTAERVRESAEHAVERVKESAGQAAVKVRGSLHDAGVAARRRPVPWLAVAGGAAALMIVFLVIRRRRR